MIIRKIAAIGLLSVTLFSVCASDNGFYDMEKKLFTGTILCHVANRGNVVKVKALLKKGISANSTTVLNMTPLLAVLRYVNAQHLGNKEERVRNGLAILKLLFAYRADANKTDIPNINLSPLGYAAKVRLDSRIIQCLWSNGARMSSSSADMQILRSAALVNNDVRMSNSSTAMRNSRDPFAQSIFQ